MVRRIAVSRVAISGCVTQPQIDGGKIALDAKASAQSTKDAEADAPYKVDFRAYFLPL